MYCNSYCSYENKIGKRNFWLLILCPYLKNNVIIIALKAYCSIILHSQTGYFTWNRKTDSSRQIHEDTIGKIIWMKTYLNFHWRNVQCISARLTFCAIFWFSIKMQFMAKDIKVQKNVLEVSFLFKAFDPKWTFFKKKSNQIKQETLPVIALMNFKGFISHKDICFLSRLDLFILFFSSIFIQSVEK